MNKLATLAKYADQLRLAELAVFLHNFGKFGTVFLKRWSNEKTAPNYSEQYVSGTLIKLAKGATNANDQSLRDRLRNANDRDTLSFLNASDKENIFEKTKITLPSPLDDRPSLTDPNKDLSYSIGFFLDLHKGFIEFEDPKRGKVFDDSKIKNLLGSDYRAIEVLQYCHELASSEEKEPKPLVSFQSETMTWVDSAFGYEKIKLDANDNLLDLKRKTFLKLLRCIFKTTKISERQYRQFYWWAKKLFIYALGDTQIPINDVTLWDLSHSTASFFKSAVAGLICSGKTKNHLQPGFHKDLKWRYLTISIDFHKFVTSSQKIIDMVHRKDYLIHVYNQIKHLLEVEYPLANEIYRDENGPVFLVPEVDDDLLKWTDNQTETLEEKITNCFRKAFPEKEEEKDGQLKIIEALPHIHISKEVFAGEKKGTLQHALKRRKPGFSADPALLNEVWSFDSVKKAHPEICPVCRLRPVGFDENGNQDSTAKDRNICAVCLDRRSGRAKNWYDFGRKQTIWIEETADENGRAALLCGDFNLDLWLDGTLIETTFQKNPSFARIRRCWETTNQFWQEVLDGLIIKVAGQSSKRILINPSKRLSKLNRFQAYELRVKDIYLNAIWLGDKFISADNLIVFSKRLAALMKRKKPDKSISIEKAIDLLKVLLGEAKSVEIFEPPHYSQGRSKEPIDTFEIRSEDIKPDEEDYFPFIPILQSPTRFYCIVPASDAFAIGRLINQKYQEEMGKVRDRLSLKLGIVYFQKYVPAAAVLDAGNRLLAYPQNDEIYQIEQVNSDSKYWINSSGKITSKGTATHARFEMKNITNNRKAWFDIELKNKNGVWDEAHPALRVVNEIKPDADGTLKYERILAREVGAQKILFAQSYFDYIYLDTASKRFETSIDKVLTSRFHPITNLKQSPRPYQIEDVEKLHQIWEYIKIAPVKPKMTKTKLYGIRDLLSQRISHWHVYEEHADEDVKEIFEKFVEKIIFKEFGYAEGSIPFNLLKASMLNGSFFDCLDIQLHILKEKLP